MKKKKMYIKYFCLIEQQNDQLPQKAINSNREKEKVKQNLIMCFYLKISIHFAISPKLKRCLQIMAIASVLIYATIFLQQNVYGYNHNLQVINVWCYTLLSLKFIKYLFLKVSVRL
jgi:hypothetical protein